MTEPEFGPGPGRHYGEFQADEVWAPARYARGPLVGAGRWCDLYRPVGQAPVLVVYTDDKDVLGALQYVADPRSVPAVQMFAQVLLAAAHAGTPAREVFETWRSRDGRGLAAGPTRAGDLRTLADDPQLG